MKVCKKCGAVSEDDAAVCSDCGNSFVEQPKMKKCDVCGHDLAIDARVCPHCGHEFLAVKCRICGCDLVNDYERSQGQCVNCERNYTPEKAAAVKSAKPKGISCFAVIACIIFVMLVGTVYQIFIDSNKDSEETTAGEQSAIYNTVVDVPSIWGKSKSEVDSIIGDPIGDFGNGVYAYGENILITYIYNDIYMITIIDNSCIYSPYDLNYMARVFNIVGLSCDCSPDINGDTYAAWSSFDTYKNMCVTLVQNEYIDSLIKEIVIINTDMVK